MWHCRAGVLGWCDWGDFGVSTQCGCEVLGEVAGEAAGRDPWDFKGSAQWGCGVLGFDSAAPAPLPAGGICSPGFAAPALPGDGAGEGFVEQLRSRGKLGRALLPTLRGDRDWVRCPESDAGGVTKLKGWVTGQQLRGLGGGVGIAAVGQIGRVQWLIDDPGR